MGRRIWSGVYSPLMKLGTYSAQCGPHGIGGGNLIGAPRELLDAAATYCNERLVDYKRRPKSHKRRNAIKYYYKWLCYIERERNRVPIEVTIAALEHAGLGPTGASGLASHGPDLGPMGARGLASHGPDLGPMGARGLASVIEPPRSALCEGGPGIADVPPRTGAVQRWKRQVPLGWDPYGDD